MVWDDSVLCAQNQVVHLVPTPHCTCTAVDLIFTGGVQYKGPLPRRLLGCAALLCMVASACLYARLVGVVDCAKYKARMALFWGLVDRSILREVVVVVVVW